MTKKLLISAVVLSAVPVLDLNAQDSASYQKNYSSYLAEWERDLNRRSGIAVPERQTVADEASSSDSPWAPPRHKRMEQAWDTSPSSSDKAVSVEAFYAMALDDVVKDYDELDKIDLCGVNVQYSWKQKTELMSLLSGYELFASAGFATGSEKVDWTDEYTVNVGQVSVGGNLVWEVNPMWDVFVGARIGLSYISIKNEWDDGWESGSSRESGVGCIYGVRIGTNIHFSENHALTLAADYWGTTARAEDKIDYDDGYSETEKSEAQSYCVFSVGYKYSF